MAYDVFISYSRKDSAQANSLCKALDEAGISYWIDRNNIQGSASFAKEISQCIRHCKVVLFIASANSASSIWTTKEVVYALEYEKTIVPYRIDHYDFRLNRELEFIFTNIQWVESEKEALIALKNLGLTSGDTVTNRESLDVITTPATNPISHWWGELKYAMSQKSGLLNFVQISAIIVALLLVGIVVINAFYHNYYSTYTVCGALAFAGIAGALSVFRLLKNYKGAMLWTTISFVCANLITDFTKCALRYPHKVFDYSCYVFGFTRIGILWVSAIALAILTLSMFLTRNGKFGVEVLQKSSTPFHKDWSLLAIVVSLIVAIAFATTNAIYW